MLPIRLEAYGIVLRLFATRELAEKAARLCKHDVEQIQGIYPEYPLGYIYKTKGGEWWDDAGVINGFVPDADYNWAAI